MSQHISQEDDTVAQLFVDGMLWRNSPHTTSLVGVKLNHFACGGMAVGISMSHAFGDGCTLGSFVRHWASVARHGFPHHTAVLPFNPHLIQFGAIPTFIPLERSVFGTHSVNRATRKFVFPNSKLNDLKNKVLTLAEGVSTLSIKNPTRVEVLTSLLYKSAVVATSQTSSSFKPCFLLVAANIRNKLVPKQPQTAVGNMITGMLVTTRGETEKSLTMLVSEIQKQKMELEQIQSLQLTRKSIDSVTSRLVNKDLKNIYDRYFYCSSLCGFPYYKVDFGWGKPAVASVTFRTSNESGAVLMDTPNGDGIEAWVTLERQDMERFENEKELLQFSQT